MSIADKLTTIAENEQKVYDAGKKSQYDEFWDAYQVNGTRRNYYRAFLNAYNTPEALGWNTVTFRPKYDLKPTTIAQGFLNLKVSDLDALLKECGVVLDTSNCTAFQQAFQGSMMTVFPTLHLKIPSELIAVFYACTKLHTIRKIIFESGTRVNFTDLFSGCSALANIDEVEGSIERNISFSSSPLTVSAMKKIISHLKDYSGTDSEYTYTVTLKSTAFSALEEEGATAEYNGTACTWAELVDNKKWNLTLA